MYMWVYTGMSTVVVSIRIRRDVKETLEEAGVNIAEEARRYLEELAWKIKVREQVEKWDELLSNVKPSPKGFSEQSVREDRESH